MILLFQCRKLLLINKFNNLWKLKAPIYVGAFCVKYKTNNEQQIMKTSNILLQTPDCKLIIILLTSYFLLQINCQSYSQSLILLRSKRVIHAEIISINKDSIKFLRTNSHKNSYESLPRSSISMVLFDIGRKDFVPFLSASDSIKFVKSYKYPGKLISNFFGKNKDSIVRKGGPSNLFLSLIVPGLGDYFVRDPGAYWTIAVISYGLVGTGIYYNNLSNIKYKQYKETAVPNGSIYKNANNKHHAYYILTGLGAGIWLSDVVSVAIKGFKNRHKFQVSSNKTQASRLLGVSLCNNGFGIKLNFK